MDGNPGHTLHMGEFRSKVNRQHATARINIVTNRIKFIIISLYMTWCCKDWPSHHTVLTTSCMEPRCQSISASLAGMEVNDINHQRNSSQSVKSRGSYRTPTWFRLQLVQLCRLHRGSSTMVGYVTFSDPPDRDCWPFPVYPGISSEFQSFRASLIFFLQWSPARRSIPIGCYISFPIPGL